MTGARASAEGQGARRGSANSVLPRLPDDEVVQAAELALAHTRPAKRQRRDDGVAAGAEDLVRAVESIVRAVRRADGDDVVVRGMCSYVTKRCTDASSFVDEVLPAALRGISNVRRLAAELTVLDEGRATCVQVSRQLAHALLSCALFGVCKPATGCNWPFFSMEPLWRVVDVDDYEAVRAKVACQLAYHHEAFQRDNFAEDTQPLRFTRKVLVDGFDEEMWLNSTTPLGKFCVIQGAGASIGTATNALRADFANASLGGGVWSRGAVQEEILFSEEPELCVGMLLAQDLGDRETLQLEHSMRYSMTEGYRATLRFAKPLHPPESYGPVVAMDALYSQKAKGKRQYTTYGMVRELRKSLCAFLPCESAHVGGDGDGGDDAADVSLLPVATGNWGCGAFGGDPQLKALLQWLSASTARRPIDYYTHRDPRVAKSLNDNLISNLRSRYVTVGGLFSALCTFHPDRCGDDLFDWLKEECKLKSAN